MLLLLPPSFPFPSPPPPPPPPLTTIISWDLGRARTSGEASLTTTGRYVSGVCLSRSLAAHQLPTSSSNCINHCPLGQLSGGVTGQRSRTALGRPAVREVCVGGRQVSCPRVLLLPFRSKSLHLVTFTLLRACSERCSGRSAGCLLLLDIWSPGRYSGWLFHFHSVI